jgi:hypothetical protein
MQAILLTPDLYSKWDDFCLGSADAWFWHTTDYLRYQLHYHVLYHPVPLSFVVVDDRGEWLGAVPLLLEERQNDEGRSWKELSTGIGSRDFPALRSGLGSHQAKKLVRLIVSTLDALAHQHDAARVVLKASPLSAPQTCSPVAIGLLEAGFQFIPGHSQVVDLSKSRAELWSDVRKRYQPMINGAIQHGLHVGFHFGSDCGCQLFDSYRNLHAKDAGRVTRAVETFDSQFEWIRTNRAALASASFQDGREVGFAYIICFKQKAYYMSGCADPDVAAEHNIGHALQWKAIETLQELGFRNYELGEQHFGPSFFFEASDKEVSISLFKRGMGGELALIPTFEKFYDPALLEGTMQRRVSTLVDRVERDVRDTPPTDAHY